ncbi:MAG TPA: hypothetical protein PKB10_04120 [Tepidisphaeraceae bacterium]|nr:hypothetical protein [Tepidisphaeraceae bacterium]
MPDTPEYAVLLAVGPRPDEIDRVRDLVAAIGHYEPGRCAFVMVDDVPTPRGLDKLIDFPPHIRPIVAHHPRHGQVIIYKRGKGICSAILLCLQIAARQTRADFVLKLDTDSHVIAPFSQKIRTAFAANPTVGEIGAYTLTPNNTPRDFSRNGSNIQSRHALPRFDWKHPIRSMKARRDPLAARLRRHIDDAVANGYVYGEHCLGGGYAISRPCLDAMNARGYLDDPSLWLAIDCPEDVMAGLYVKAAGFGIANHVGTNEVFGVRHMGLPYPPEELVQRGYSVIHAVKNDPNVSEPDIRAYFAKRRQ